MIKEIKEINNINLSPFLNYLFTNKSDFLKLENDIGKRKLDNNYGTIFYEADNKLFTSFSISFDKNEIVQISFSGKFNITFMDLVVIYGEFREVYAAKDDMYFYFFNENKNYTIGCKFDYKIMQDTFNSYVTSLSIKYR